MMLTEDFYSEVTLASEAASNRIAQALSRELAIRCTASLIVSGGSTPIECFSLLSNTELAWDKVSILMSDERCVAPEHAASNEGMIRRSLTTNCAAGAGLVPIYREGFSAADQCAALSAIIENMVLPFTVALVGMGEDGHIASLFPDFDRLSEALDVNTGYRCLPVNTAASPHQRVSLTLSTVLHSREILLLFFGEAKRAVYERAKRPESRLPLSRLLQQDRSPVRAIWAP